MLASSPAGGAVSSEESAAAASGEGNPSRVHFNEGSTASSAARRREAVPNSHRQPALTDREVSRWFAALLMGGLPPILHIHLDVWPG